MALDELDREDLLRQATGLVPRIELSHTGIVDNIVVGFRQNAASFFFGEETVYQFNSLGELRRAYVGGLLYKATSGHLVALTRHRTDTAVELLSHQLNDQEAVAFSDRMHGYLKSLTVAVANNRYTVVGQVPEGVDVVEQISDVLPQILVAEIARSPRSS